MAPVKKLATDHIAEVIQDAEKHGEIVPNQATKETVPGEVVEIGDFSAKWGVGTILRINGVDHRLEEMPEDVDPEKPIDPKRGVYVMQSGDNTEYLAVRLAQENEKPSLLDRAKDLVKNKKFYISAGATTVALAVGAVIVKLATSKAEDEIRDEETQLDSDVENTESA